MSAYLFDMGSKQRRRDAGRAAKRAGQSFEQLVLSSGHDADGAVMELVAVKNFARRIVFTRKDGTKEFKLIEERSPFDAVGVIYESAQAVAFDCKRIDAASFPVHHPNMVKPHQIKELMRLERAGAVAGFLVYCLRLGDYRWLGGTAAWRASLRMKPLQWDDPSWVVFGKAVEGRAVPLRSLLDRLVERNPVKQ